MRLKSTSANGRDDPRFFFHIRSHTTMSNSNLPVLEKHPRFKRLLLTALLAVIPAAATAQQLTVEGNLTSTYAKTYSFSELQSLGGAVTKNIAGDIYNGVPLWTLLGGTSGITIPGTPPLPNNSILRSYVTATSSSGATSLISVGEIHPNFGGVGDPVIVAFAKNGVTLSSPLLIDAEDPSHTRNVADLVSLNVGILPQPSGGTGGQSTTVTLSGVANPGTFDLAALQAFPATTLTGIAFNNGTPFDYTGVKLWDFLVARGIDTSATARGYVLATATDNVAVTFALSEIDPARRGPDDVLLAYDRSAGGLGTAGFARIAVPDDNRGGRYLSNVVSLEVGYIQAVPEAHTWLMMVAGLGLVALVGRHRALRG